MLNYGIDILKKQCNKKDFVCIVSGHCFFEDKNSIKKIVDHLNSVKNCRSAFGRQVPMTISDPQAIRDLVLMYPKENRLISKAPAFNNAFSLISYEALNDNKFDSNTTNLEDVIWASKELDKGYKIAYCSSSEIVHYHGPHQENTAKRLLKTELTIKNNSDIFNISLKKACVESHEILPIFIGDYLKKDLLNQIRKTHKTQKIILWTNQINFKEFNIDNENINLIKRDSYESEDKSLYEILPSFYEKLVKNNLISPFYIIYDNSYESNYNFVDMNMALNAINNNYGDIIWPAIKSKKLLFSLNEDFKWVSNQLFDDDKFEKNKAIEIIRGNGTICSFSSLLEPRRMFNDPNFLFLD